MEEEFKNTKNQKKCRWAKVGSYKAAITNRMFCLQQTGVKFNDVENWKVKT